MRYSRLAGAVLTGQAVVLFGLSVCFASQPSNFSGQLDNVLGSKLSLPIYYPSHTRFLTIAYHDGLTAASPGNDVISYEGLSPMSYKRTVEFFKHRCPSDSRARSWPLPLWIIHFDESGGKKVTIDVIGKASSAFVSESSWPVSAVGRTSIIISISVPSKEVLKHRLQETPMTPPIYGPLFFQIPQTN
jgi:hypothetical protein